MGKDRYDWWLIWNGAPWHTSHWSRNYQFKSDVTLACLLTLAYLDHWNDLNIEMISLDQYKVPWSVSFNITQLIISLKNTPHHIQKSPLSQRTLPPYIILYWHHSRTGMTHKAHKTFVDARKSAAIKRHIKIFMLILTHLLSVFGFKMTSLENFTKWNCS